MSTAVSAEVQALAAPMSMAERWAMPAPDGNGYLLADPLTRQRLEVNRPPAWIQDDALLRSGLTWLRRNAANLQLTTVYGSHEFYDDLGDLAEGRYEQLVAAADFYGYEGAYHSQEELCSVKELAAEIINDVRSRGRTPAVEHFVRHGQRNNISTFTMRRIAATTLIGTPSFPVDVASDGTTIEQVLSTLARPLLAHPDAYMIGMANLGVQNAREWTAVARAGVEAEQRFGRILHSPLRGLITFGREHRDLSRKYGTQGVQVDNEEMPEPAETVRTLLTAALDMPGVLRTGVVTAERLKIAALFGKSILEIS